MPDETADLLTVLATTAPCQEATDADLWFAEQQSDVEHAKSLCRRCPVREACLRGAIAREEPWGVWGGEVFVGGEVVATKRGRGRPRKNPAVA
ncbi:WhiB family transcriptional regulator [Georgenia sp. MJ170]